MRTLITLDIDWAIPYTNAEVTINGVTSNIFTEAACLAKPNYDWLDDDLRYLVMLCTCMQLQSRPSLDSLFETIQWHINNKTWEYYRDGNFPWGVKFMEQDRVMQDFLHRWIFYPDYDPD